MKKSFSILISFVFLFSATFRTDHELSTAAADTEGLRVLKTIALPQMFAPSGKAEASRSWLYGVVGFPFEGDLRRIDSRTGATVKETWTGSSAANIMLQDIAITSDGRLFGMRFGFLSEINQQTREAERITLEGRFSPEESGDLACGLGAAPNGDLYYITENRGYFGVIDVEKRTVRMLGRIRFNATNHLFAEVGGDIAFSPTGEMFAVRTLNRRHDQLVEINPRTFQWKIVGSTSAPVLSGLAFGPDGRLYGSAFGNFIKPPLAVIDTKTGNAEYVGDIQVKEKIIEGLAANVRRSPVVGPLSVIDHRGICNPDASAKTWSFCQHRLDRHQPGKGIGGSDDSYAWDINLGRNNDAARAVFAVAPGRVVRYAGKEEPGGPLGAILIEHAIGGALWWSGYQHLKQISVEEGDVVDQKTKLGVIGNTAPGSIDEHLHFVVYEGENKPGKLRSVDASFFHRKASL